METYLLTRRDHDLLIEYFPSWMADNFPRLKKSWTLAGCRLVDTWAINVIRWQLEEIHAHLQNSPTSETAAG